MPLTKILQNAKIEFWAAGFDPNYPAETFSFVVASEDGSNIVSLNTWTTSNPYAKYIVDLSGYAGETVFLGFRHHTAEAAYALCIDNITVTNALWAGTASETDHYNVYRSFNGTDYTYIGGADGDATSYEDYAIQNVNQYYKVTAVNTIAGGETCESAFAMSVDGIHDYVYMQTLGIDETKQSVSVYPNPTHGHLSIEGVGMKHITVMNALGQVVMEAPVETEKVTLNLGQYGSGMYLIRVEAERETLIKKVSVVE